MALDNFRRINMQINKANYYIDTQMAKEGDYNGRELVVQITDDGEIKNQTGVSLNLGWRHDSVGNTGLDPFSVVDISKGIFKIAYPKEMLNAGLVTAVIQVLENGRITLTRNFKITVEKNPIDEDAIVSENSFTVLQEAISKVNNLDSKIASVETELKEELGDLDLNTTNRLANFDAQLLDVEKYNQVANSEIANNITTSSFSKTNDFPQPITQVTNTTSDAKKHVAFTAMAINGNDILMAYRRAAKHISSNGTQDNGAIVQKKSTDGGKSWGSETVIYPSTVNFDGRDPNIFQVSSTTLLMIAPIVELNANGSVKGVENKVYKTTDFGSTWADIGQLPKKENGNYYHIVRGSITRSASGRILVPVWSASMINGVTTVPYIVYSDNGGTSWSVGKDIGDRQATETSLEYDSFNKLWAVMRNDPTTGIYRQRNMLISYSEDDGQTWTKSVEMPIRGHAPHLLNLGKELLLTYRNTDKYLINSSQDRYSVNVVKIKNGALSSKVYDIFNTQSSDIGYTWAVKNGENVFISFYVFAGSFGIVYIKPISLSQLTNLDFSENTDMYQNFVGVTSYLTNTKQMFGDTTVRGTGTNMASKTVNLPENVKSIRYVNAIVLNDTNVNFICSVSNLTTTSFTLNLKNIAGTFNSEQKIFYQVLYQLP